MPPIVMPGLPAAPPASTGRVALAVALSFALSFALASALASVLGLAGTPAHAQGTVSLLSMQSEIVFTTRQMGVPVEGRFTRFGAQVTLDPKQPESGRMALDIETASARFGSPELDLEVVKPTWLAASRFPEARFRSTAVRTTASGRFEVAGQLTIKGTTRELTVPVQWQQSGSTGTASGSFTIRRLDFKVGEAEWSDTSLLADEVVVRFRLVLGGLAQP
jgi:polyisoprenoid-binding protein YceI